MNETQLRASQRSLFGTPVARWRSTSTRILTAVLVTASGVLAMLFLSATAAGATTIVAASSSRRGHFGVLIIAILVIIAGVFLLVRWRRKKQGTEK